MVFTVEIRGNPKRDAEVQIYLDEEGINLLIKRLEGLKQAGHEHFMTPSWAGIELTEEKIVSSNDLVNQLLITFVTDIAKK